ncbi:MAG: putative cell wall biosynthesis protein LcpB [Chloroflexi bacterium]|nr:putative cell wall biosynthesis protein LcpB [Chloroflexota bacterium]
MENVKRNPIKIGIAFLIIAAINIAGWYLLITWNRPLGDPLDLPTLTFIPEDTKEPSETPLPTPEETQEPEITYTPTLTSTPSPTPTPEPVCGGPEYMNILVLGVSHARSIGAVGGTTGSYLYDNADAIRVARVDFRNQQVTVVSLPRDLWVDIPVSVPGKTTVITPAKLTSAYFFGTEGMGYYTGSGYGSGLMAETLQNNFGLHVDNYVTINPFGFRKVIDALGGVHVCLAEPVYKKKTDYYSGLEFPVHYIDAGCQKLDGEELEAAVRQRINLGDFARVRRQTIILKALAAKILTPSGLKALPELIKRFKTYALLDLSPADISKLLCLAEKIDYEADIVYATIPEDMYPPGWVENIDGQYTYALVPDKAKLQELMADFQQGLWP